jgi:hypothetical protein
MHVPLRTTEAVNRGDGDRQLQVAAAARVSTLAAASFFRGGPEGTHRIIQLFIRS